MPNIFFCKSSRQEKEREEEVADKLHLQKGGGQLFSTFSHFDVHIIIIKNMIYCQRVSIVVKSIFVQLILIYSD